MATNLQAACYWQKALFADDVESSGCLVSPAPKTDVCREGSVKPYFLSGGGICFGKGATFFLNDDFKSF